jgi:DNA-directed RNA polymerase subunit H (RpoH/RPB5)
MRRVLNVLMVLFLGNALALAVDLPPIDKWVNYEAPDKSFKAIFAQEPKVAEQQAGTIKINMYINELGDSGALLIATNNMPKIDTADAAIVKATFDGGVKGAMKNLMGNITKETDITWQGKFPCRDVQATAKLGDIEGIVRVKMILANDKLYQVMAVGEKDVISKTEIDKFLESLEIK